MYAYPFPLISGSQTTVVAARLVWKQGASERAWKWSSRQVGLLPSELASCHAPRARKSRKKKKKIDEAKKVSEQYNSKRRGERSKIRTATSPACSRISWSSFLKPPWSTNWLIRRERETKPAGLDWTGPDCVRHTHFFFFSQLGSGGYCVKLAYSLAYFLAYVRKEIWQQNQDPRGRTNDKKKDLIVADQDHVLWS